MLREALRSAAAVPWQVEIKLLLPALLTITRCTWWSRLPPVPLSCPPGALQCSPGPSAGTSPGKGPASESYSAAGSVAVTSTKRVVGGAASWKGATCSANAAVSPAWG